MMVEAMKLFEGERGGPIVAAAMVGLLVFHPVAAADPPGADAVDEDGDAEAEEAEEPDAEAALEPDETTGEEGTEPLETADESPSASRAEPPAPPPVSPSRAADPVVVLHTERVRVSLASDQPELTFHRRNGSRGYDEICTAPCEISLMTGSHSLALSRGTGRLVAVRNRIAVTGPTTIKGTYVSRRGLRKAGWFVGFGGFLGGLVLTTVAISTVDIDDDEPGTAYRALSLAGLGSMLVGPGVGLWMILQRDKATIEIEPRR
jgi:hypothetical protein